MLAFTLLSMLGCGDPLLPGPRDESLTLEGPIAGLDGSQEAAHARGDAEFARSFTPATGLGPLFVATSCASCHVGDGRGHPLFTITRFGRSTATGFDAMEPHGGPQLQNRAIPGYSAEILPPGASAIAGFMAPGVTGLGFLEAVEDATILALADPDDSNSDGISGRPALVDSSDFIAEIISLSSLFQRGEQTRHVPVNGKFVGRFGKKARTINLLHQTVFAYSQDMGITTDLVPRELLNVQTGAQATDLAPDPEAGSGIVDAVVFYLRTLRPPPRRNVADPDVIAGEKLFVGAGCASCHVSTLRTGASDLKPLDRVEFHPFTDLLLHDMGPELDDGYTEGDALPSEWRTAPLWGLGLAEKAQGGTAFYLHDGRARTLRDAIKAHGGEAARSRGFFDELSTDQQERLLAYLRSL
ncbi:MAG: di-heme oxidoredictase family protein [Gemmatimonadaceae bacterium]